MNKRYFPVVKDAPAPLRHVVERRVRFEEVDSLRIVWHGRYPSYFEDARMALSEKHGIGYTAFYEHQVPVPIKICHIDYCTPLYYDELVTIETIMHYSEVARLNFEYVIRNGAGVIATKGYSVQLMLDKDFELLLEPPAFYRDFCDRWKRGELT